MDQVTGEIDVSDNILIIPGYKNPNVYCQDVLHNTLSATKASNELPSAGEDFGYYSTFEGFKTVMLHKGQTILNLMTSLVQKYGIHQKFQGRELEEKFDLLVDVNDVILENISNYIDEASGLKKSEEELIMAVKPQSVINTSWNKKQFKFGSQSYKLLAAKNIPRPQLAFKDKIDNSNSLFVPIIKEKPNAIKPLAIILEKDGDREEFSHPYEVEIEKFVVAEEILQIVQPKFPKPLEETPLIFVKNVEQLNKMCTELKQEKEFAVDLEHHNYRSFQGFSCLMQLSTRENDYIVDVLELRSELFVLNEVFTNPHIVKVFHGADMDVLWLQRDFGIYVVNLFDTGQAARILHFAHLSLSYLLKHYCKLDVDKKFQLADWRIRPLPAEMIKYAREDTHYLLYIYDCLRNDLIQNGNDTKNLLRITFERSKMICLKTYQKPLFSEDRYIDLYKKSKKTLNAKQLHCLKELFAWRDKIARENDESIAYVLPNHMLLQIAEALPREQQGILACCNPIPPLVKQQLNEIHSLVLKSNESSLKQLAELEFQNKSKSYNNSNQIDLSNLLHCPHDIIHAEEKKSYTSETFHADISLPLITKEESPAIYLRKEPSLKPLFVPVLKNMRKKKGVTKSKTVEVSEILSKLLSPFQRYKITEELHVNQKNNSDIEIINDTPDIIEEVHMNDEENKSDVQIINDNSFKQNIIKPVSSPSISSTTVCNDSVIDIKNTTTEHLSSSTSHAFISTPLRKKNKRKKRNSKPDISLRDTSVSSVPPRKKAKSPEIVTIDDESFQPYDYSESDYKTFSGRKKSKGTFKLGTQHNFKGPGKHFGHNRKHFKQATFGNNSNQSKKKWPRNN